MAGIWGTVVIGHVLALSLAVRAIAASTLTLKHVFLPALTSAFMLTITSFGCGLGFLIARRRSCARASARSRRSRSSSRARRSGAISVTPSWASPTTPMSTEAVTPLMRSFVDLSTISSAPGGGVLTTPFGGAVSRGGNTGSGERLYDSGSFTGPPSGPVAAAGAAGGGAGDGAARCGSSTSMGGLSAPTTPSAANAETQIVPHASPGSQALSGTLSRRSRNAAGAFGGSAAALTATGQLPPGQSQPCTPLIRSGQLPAGSPLPGTPRSCSVQLRAGSPRPGTPLARAVAEHKARPPLWEYMVISFVTAWAVLLTVVASAWTDPAVLCLLASWQVPSTLVWATALFGSTYSPTHSVGALLVATGCAGLSVFTSSSAEEQSARWGSVVALVAASLTSLSVVLIDRAAWRGADRLYSITVTCAIGAGVLYVHAWLFERVEFPGAIAMLTVQNSGGDEARVAVATVAVSGAFVIWTLGMTGRKISASVTLLAKPASAAWAVAARFTEGDVFPPEEMAALGAALAVCATGVVLFVTSRGGAAGLPSAEAVQIHAELELARSARTAESAEEDWDSVSDANVDDQPANEDDEEEDDDDDEAGVDPENDAERQPRGRGVFGAARRGNYVALRNADDDANVAQDPAAYARAKRRAAKAAPNPSKDRPAADVGPTAGRARGRGRHDFPTSYEEIFDAAYAAGELEEEEEEEDEEEEEKDDVEAQRSARGGLKSQDKNATRSSARDATAASAGRRAASKAASNREIVETIAPDVRVVRKQHDAARGVETEPRGGDERGAVASGRPVKRSTAQSSRARLVSRSEARYHASRAMEQTRERESTDEDDEEEEDAGRWSARRRAAGANGGRQRYADGVDEDVEDNDDEDDTEVYEGEDEAGGLLSSEPEPPARTMTTTRAIKRAGKGHATAAAPKPSSRPSKASKATKAAKHSKRASATDAPSADAGLFSLSRWFGSAPAAALSGRSSARDLESGRLAASSSSRQRKSAAKKTHHRRSVGDDDDASDDHAAVEPLTSSRSRRARELVDDLETSARGLGRRSHHEAHGMTVDAASRTAAQARLGAPKATSASDRFRRASPSEAPRPPAEVSGVAMATVTLPSRRGGSTEAVSAQGARTDAHSHGDGQPRLVTRAARTVAAFSEGDIASSFGIWKLGKPVSKGQAEDDEDRHAPSVRTTPQSTQQTAPAHKGVRAAATAPPLPMAASAASTRAATTAAAAAAALAAHEATITRARTASARTLEPSTARTLTAAAGHNRPRLMQARTTVANPMGPGFRISRRGEN